MKKLSQIIIVIIFIATRWFIWTYRPIEFTEIIYSYMPYAHLWASGTQPYLEQWYEYPPGTIPLFYLPHKIDMATLEQRWHVNYLTAYRGILLVVDIGLFSLIWLTLKRLKLPIQILTISLLYYCLATAKAHHFIYDSMDLTFALGLTMSVVMPILLTKKWGSFWSWFGFFLATVLKYINAPLAIPYAVLERHDLKGLLIRGTLAFLLIWALPLSIYRTSLSVSLVYHRQRGLQVESVPAQIAATINRFTKSEHYEEVYKNYDVAGPVSTKIKHIYTWLFPLALVLYTGWTSIVSFKSKQVRHDRLRIVITLGYIYCFMFFANVLSTPFLLWQIPLVALLPLKTWKRQLLFIIPSLIMISISMTSIPNLPLGIFSVHLLIGWVRSALIFGLFCLTIIEIRRLQGPQT